MGKTHSVLLLATLIAFLALTPFVQEGRTLSLLFTVLLIGMVYAMSYRRHVLIFGIAMAVPALGLEWAGQVADSAHLHVAGSVFAVILLAFAIWVAMRHLLKKNEVDAETLRQALIVYLLLGITWAILFGIAVHFDPHALAGVAGPGSQKLAYFSFVTLTTLGYGDISPANPVTQSLAVLEALAGQIFLAFLVARLVGLQIAQRRDKG